MAPSAVLACDVSTDGNSMQKDGIRPFEFCEFFAGMAGFSKTMEELGGSSVNVVSPLDGYEGWNILESESYAQAEGVCECLDHGHFAPPCRTLTFARRDDEYGQVKQLRSFECPEGFGDEEAVEANKIVEAMVCLILLLVSRGKTFAVENPWGSFLWCLKIMAKVMRLPGVELILLHQCAYGSVTPKPTGILTNAEWMKVVCNQCRSVRDHYHLKGGLVGKAWSYLSDCLVWRTSLAAEYPCGLTIAWARSLLDWLSQQQGRDWMLSRSFKLVGRWKNVLVRSNMAETQRNVQTLCESNSERRERENQEAIGGLRFAKRAVSRSTPLQTTGSRIRSVMDTWMNDDMINMLQSCLSNGIEQQDIVRLRALLAQEFGASLDVNEYAWPVSLWSCLLAAALDPDRDVLPTWMTEGFPLGICCDIDYTGVFPKTEEDTGAVEASRLHGELMHDEKEDAMNYASFTKAGDKAQGLLDQMVSQGRARMVHSWHDVVQQVGPRAQLTKMGCIIKVKEDMSEKVRLIFDGRRSGVNGQIHCRERVTLPRISDVADGYLQLLSNNAGWNDAAYPEWFTADFKDAFHMLQLREDEKAFVVMKGQDDHLGRCRYYISNVVVFGLTTGPLLWSRLAAATMRLSQSVLKQHEANVCCYIDDPVIGSVASTPAEHTRHFLYYAALWLALGLDISWKKVSRGQSIQWIGFQLSLVGPSRRDLLVELAPSKRDKLMSTLQELDACRGMVPIHLLQYAVGVLGWLSSAIPLARPWLAMLWAAITQVRDPVRNSTRRRKGLVFVKQVNNAITWLKALLHLREGYTGLHKLHCWAPHAKTVMIQTDASPFGLGGLFGYAGEIKAYFTDHLHDEDFAMFQSCWGDPAYQSEYELLAVLVALRAFAELIKQCGATRVVLRCDNTSVLRAAFAYKASSPIMAQLTAELALELEAQQVKQVVPQHVAGILNGIADALSRPHSAAVPTVLHACQRCEVPRRPRAYYRAWPER